MQKLGWMVLLTGLIACSEPADVALGDENSSTAGNSELAELGLDGDGSKFLSVSAGEFYTCGLRDNGTIECWGRDEAGVATPIPGVYQAVEASTHHTCGIKTNGAIECWGNYAEFLTIAPEGLFQSVSTGLYHTCGLTVDGTITCSGDDSYWQASPPEGTFQAVAAGQVSTCGIKVDGTLACWGETILGFDSPGDDNRFIDGGLEHYCAIQGDESVSCWGTDSFGEASPPDSLFKTLSAGLDSTCGITMDNTITCWGANTYGQREAPVGQFVSVSVGNSHACAVSVDGAVVCWGANGFGQATPPSSASTEVQPGELDLDSVSLVPAGPFWLGCDPSGQPDCFPGMHSHHQVQLDGFYIDTHEVTVKEYRGCVNTRGCERREFISSPGWLNDQDEHPMSGISWEEARAYCAWEGKRLPTEAEWEKAARGADGWLYPWGNSPEPNCGYVVKDEAGPGCGTDEAFRVGSKPAGASVYGVQDMLGNVSEWVSDFYREDYFDTPPAGGWVNPQGPDSSSYRSRRGFSFEDTVGYPTYYRDATLPGSNMSDIGFRCAMSL